jgi:stromal membrane-associated protein
MTTPKDTIPEKVQERIFEVLLNKEENRTCADCNNKGPRWVSLDFGVFICMNCAGHHRNLGPSITRVRSVKLDAWRQEWVNIMENVGNVKGNDFYEYSMPRGKKPDPSWQTNDIRKFIGDKYVKKLYAPHDKSDPVSTFLKTGDTGESSFK